MNIVQISRQELTDQGTFGRMAFGANCMYTVELPWRNNIRQKSCIPAGSYLCELVKSPRFGLVYGVRDVPGRSQVLIHSANLGGNVDLGWQTQLQGCIAPALGLGALRLNNDKFQRAGLVSRPALRKLMDWAAGRPFTLEITQ